MDETRCSSQGPDPDAGAVRKKDEAPDQVASLTASAEVPVGGAEEGSLETSSEVENGIAHPMEPQTLDPSRAIRNMAAPELPRNLRLVIALCVIFSGIGALGVHGILVWAHHFDLYQVDRPAEAMITLSRHANRGVLYPPPPPDAPPESISGFSDSSVTRQRGHLTMPVGILLNALASRLTGSFILSGKILSATAMLLLLYVMSLVMVRLRCAMLVGFAVIAAALMTQPMILAASSPSLDALPVVLQLLAVMIFLERRDGMPRITRHAVFLAALACTVAVACRLSAVWGIVAIGFWLAVNRPKWLKTFIAYQLGTLLVGAAFFHLLSDGRFFDHITGTITAGSGGASSGVGPMGLLEALHLEAPAMWVLLPLAMYGLVLRAMRGSWSIIHIGLLCTIILALLFASTSSFGAVYLLDLVVLSAIGAADLWRTASDGRRTMGFTQAAMAILLLFSSLSGFLMHIQADSVEALNTIVFGDRNPAYEVPPPTERVEAEAMRLDVETGTFKQP